MDESYLVWLQSLAGLNPAKARRVAKLFPTFEHLRAGDRDQLRQLNGLSFAEVDAIERAVRESGGRHADGRLFLCPECGSFAGTKATSCPFCGVAFSSGEEAIAAGLDEFLREEETGKLCLDCGAVMARDAIACPICRREYSRSELALLPSLSGDIDETRFCARCGAYLVAGSDDCAICGTPLARPSALPTAANSHRGLGQGFLSRWQKVVEVTPSRETERLLEELSQYDKLVETDPSLERVWAKRGRVLARLGRTVDASESLAKAAELDPSKDDEYRLEVLDLLRTKGDMSFLPSRWRQPAATSSPPSVQPKLMEALDHYDALLANDPNLAVAWRTKGEILERIGRSAEAKACFARAESIERQAAEDGRTGAAGLTADRGFVAGTPSPTRADARSTGRVNGKTNGRTNGRTYGTGGGRINGLTNGAVNGLRGAVNGVGGWTGGAGRTNGLVNGNGVTDGHRGRYAPRRLPTQPHWARSLAGIAAVVALLVLVPILASLLAPPGPPGNKIQINGSFSDWATFAAYVNAPPASFANPDINLVEVKVTSDATNLYVYAKVQGTLFFAPWTNGTESILVFIDEDHNAATGYPVGGIGADALTVVTGWDGAVQSVTRYEFNESAVRHSDDFRQFLSSGSAFAKSAGQEIEMQISSNGLPALDRVLVYGADNQGNRDAMVGIVQPARPTVVVAQRALDADIVRSFQIAFLRVDLSSLGGVAQLTGVNVSRLGNSLDGANVTVYLDDGRGAFNATERVLGQAALGLGRTFVPINYGLAGSGTFWIVVSWSNMTPASTFGIQVVDFAGNGTTSLRPPETKLVYLVISPSTPTVDGAFGDWNGRAYGQDPLGDVVNGTGSLVYDSNVDLLATAVDVGANFTGFAQVDGRILGGQDIPNDIPRPEAPSPPNGNISNATAPYVPQDGYDVLYAYIDADNSSLTGLPISIGNVSYGFDYAIAILGRNGVVNASALYRFAPTNATPWTFLAPVRAALDSHRIEFATNATPLGLSPGYRVVFYASDWRRQYDVALPDAFVSRFTLVTLTIASSVVINEVSPAPNIEWIEVANPTAGSVNLQGWTLSIVKGNKLSVIYTFGAVVLGAFGSGTEYLQALLPPNSLPNGQSTVALSAGSLVVDQTTYPSGVNGGLSWARHKDPMTGQPMDSNNDGVDFYVSTIPSPGKANDLYRPYLTIAKTASSTTGVPGQILTYRIYYNDTGALSKVVWINDTLPAGVAFLSSSVTPSTISGSTYGWIFTNVNPGTNNVLTITTQVNSNPPDGSLQTNRATFSYTDQVRRTIGAGEAWANFTFHRPLITVAKTVTPANALPGQRVTFTIYYNNTGTVPAGTVSIVDSLPSGLLYISSTPSPTVTSGTRYYWNFTSVAPGTHSITLIAQVAANFTGKQLVNWAYLNYTGANSYALAGSKASAIVAVPELSDFLFVAAVPLIVIGLRRRALRRAETREKKRIGSG